MRYLLDTHALLWFVNGDPSLRLTLNDLIADPNSLIFLSTASIWEMGKNEFALLGISTEHVDKVANLSFPLSGHRNGAPSQLFPVSDNFRNPLI